MLMLAPTIHNECQRSGEPFGTACGQNGPVASETDTKSNLWTHGAHWHSNTMEEHKKISFIEVHTTPLNPKEDR
jgi:hypothetical protein